LDLAQRVELHVRAAEAEQDAVLLRQRPRIRASLGPSLGGSAGDGVDVCDEQRPAGRRDARRVRRGGAGPARTRQHVHLSRFTFLPPYLESGRLVQGSEQLGSRPRAVAGRGVGADERTGGVEEGARERHARRVFLSRRHATRQTSAPRLSRDTRPGCRFRCPDWTTRAATPKESAMEQKPTPFLSDIQEIRRRAREHVEKGAVTSGY